LDHDNRGIKLDSESQTWAGGGETLELLDRLKPSSTDAWTVGQETQQEMRYGYRVGALGFLVNKQVQSEVVEDPSIYPVPNSPRWMVGLLNLRGNIVPVFRLHDFIESDEQKNDKKNTLILGDGDSMLGVMIDGLPKVVRNCVRESQLPSTAEKLQPYTAVTFDVEGEFWTELDCHSLAKDMVREEPVIDDAD
jgi:twitching motility protein PilI